MNVLISGSTGFLLRNTLEDFDFNILKYEFNKSYSNIDLIIHFASFTDTFEFENKKEMSFIMLDYSLELIKIAKNNNCKFIFASSVAAEELKDEYGVYKKCIELYICANLEKFCILRIPRVYGHDRKKGLMRKIKENLISENDMFNVIEYIDIEDFKIWFNSCLNKNGILTYNKKLKTNTIKELKDIYCTY